MTLAVSWLRVVIYETRGRDYQDSWEYLKASMPGFARVLGAQPGFAVAYWGHNPDDGTIAAVSHWRSRQAIGSAAVELRKLQLGAEAHGVHVLHVQNLELFPIPVAISMWSDPDKHDNRHEDPTNAEQDTHAAAHASRRFHLHLHPHPQPQCVPAAGPAGAWRAGRRPGWSITRTREVRAGVGDVQAEHSASLRQDPMLTFGATWLRVVTYKVDSGEGRAENYMRHNVEECLHVLEKQPGFQLGYWGRDLDEETVTAVTYWKSRQAIDTAAPTLHQLQAEAAAHGVHRVDVRNVRLFPLPPM